MEFRHAGAAWLTRVDYGIQRALRGFGIPGTRQLVLYKLNLYPGTVSTWFCLEKVGKKNWKKIQLFLIHVFLIFINEPRPATPGMPHRPSLKSSGKWMGFRPSPNLNANKLPTFGNTKRITPISWIPITLLTVTIPITLIPTSCHPIVVGDITPFISQLVEVITKVWWLGSPDCRLTRHQRRFLSGQVWGWRGVPSNPKNGRRKLETWRNTLWLCQHSYWKWP